MKTDQNEWLEKVLSESEPYLDNENFSQRVMHALPAQKRRTRISQRKRIVILAGIAGVLCSLPFLSSFLALPMVGALVVSQWFVTFSVMVSLGGVAAASWWLLVVRE